MRKLFLFLFFSINLIGQDCPLNFAGDAYIFTEDGTVPFNSEGYFNADDGEFNNTGTVDLSGNANYYRVWDGDALPDGVAYPDGNVIQNIQNNDLACLFVGVTQPSVFDYDPNTTYCVCVEVAFFGSAFNDAPSWGNWLRVDIYDSDWNGIWNTSTEGPHTDNGTFTDISDLTDATWDIVCMEVPGSELDAWNAEHFGFHAMFENIFFRAMHIGECLPDPTCFLPKVAACAFDSAGEANLACDDNGTGSDGTDDFFTLDLNPSGTDLGSNYSVAVSSGTIAPATAAYGAATSFTITDDLTAASDIVVTITDDVDGTCQFTLTITDPSACSTPDPCSITAAGEANLACDDNGTGSDGTDDFLTLDLNPSGTMLGSNYSVSVSSGTIAPATAAYGAATSFTITDDLTAASDIVVTITDDVDGTCQFTLTITDPSACSTPDPCSITAAGEANLACDDNGTGSDGTDDFLTLDLNPSGTMLGSNYSVSVSSGTIAPATAAYGAATSFTITDDLTAASDIVVTITDDVTGTCQFLLTITDPSACSTPDPCSITEAGEANLACDDNGTGSDGTDDFLTLDLNPSGTMLGSNYSVSVISGTIAPATAAYGAPTSFTITDDLTAASDIVVTITDDVTGTCQFILTITDPLPCSSSCSLTVGDFGLNNCDGKGTEEVSDDTFDVDVNATSINGGASGQFTVTDGTAIWGPFDYGTGGTVTGLSADGSNITLTFIDVDDNSCNNLATISQESCSPIVNPCIPIECDCIAITEDDYTRICDDASNSHTYTASTALSNVVWTNSAGVEVGTGPTLTVDSNTPGMEDGMDTYFHSGVYSDDCPGNSCCDVPIVTEPCGASQECQISNVSFENLVCDNNATLEDETDDFYTVDIIVEYTGNIPADGGIIVNGMASVTATGSPQTFSLQLPADGTSPAISVEFESNASCSGFVVLDPLDSCSTTCVDNIAEFCEGETFTLSTEAGATLIQWYYDGNPIDAADGGNDSEIIVSEPGIYHYSATNFDGCTGELCCPFELILIDCCPAPQCIVGSMTKN